MSPLRLLPALFLLSACSARRPAGGVGGGAVATSGAPHGAAEAVLAAAAADPEPGLRAAALAARIRTSPEPAGGAWAP
ncbi:MAG: ROK family transcriptional regulator, partial [Myxococcota bacterium]|nr:ROK family transcriptional regulator [Myxococcota bacterium]